MRNLTLKYIHHNFVPVLPFVTHQSLVYYFHFIIPSLPFFPSTSLLSLVLCDPVCQHIHHAQLNGSMAVLKHGSLHVLYSKCMSMCVLVNCAPHS